MKRRRRRRREEEGTEREAREGREGEGGEGRGERKRNIASKHSRKVVVAVGLIVFTVVVARVMLAVVVVLEVQL